MYTNWVLNNVNQHHVGLHIQTFTDDCTTRGKSQVEALFQIGDTQAVEQNGKACTNAAPKLQG